MNVKPIIKFQTLEQLKGKVTNILDNWILQELQDLYDYIHQQMGEYHLFGIVKRIEDFVENLSKWYLNLSKRRIKNFAPNQSNTEQNTEQTEVTISVICEVLRYYSLIMAPFAPFYAEHLNQYLFNLKNEHKKENDPEYQSPHLEQIPRQIWEKNEQNLELMKKFKVIVELARGLRTKHNVMFKQSLKMVRIYCRDAKFQNQMEQLEEYLEENLNYQTIEYAQDLDSVVKYAIEVDTKVCGKRLGKNLRKVLNQIDELNQKPDSWKNLNKEDPPNIIVTIDEEQFILNPDEYHLKMVGETSKLTKTQDLDIHQEMVLMIDFENNPEIEKMSETRKLVRILMQLRKIAKLEPKDQVEYYWQDQSAKTDQSTEQDLPEFTPNIIDILQNNDPFLLSLLKQPVQPFDHSKTSIVCQKISYMNQKTPNTITLYLAK